jgi:hypothetical protein
VAHFKHQSGSLCKGESVLHIAAKVRLLEAVTLRERPFVIRRVCQRLACDATHDEPWEVPDYDEAGVEVQFGTYWLDVATIASGTVGVGFEVFVTHRVDTVKSANLSVPWLELQAQATVEDPYVLQPVVDLKLTGDDESWIRGRLGATRADLPQRVQDWVNWARATGVRVNESSLPRHLVEKMFESRREGISFLPAWWCPDCADARDRWRQAALMAAQELEGLARKKMELQARAVREREREQQEFERIQAARLVAQRAVFGPWLQVPFHRHIVMDMEKNAAVLRVACQYLVRHWPGAERRLRRWSGQNLIARRCWSCQRPILCLDARGFVRDSQAFYPLAEYCKPKQGRRGHFVSRCLACREEQPLQDLRRGGFVVLRDDTLLTWVDGFQGLKRAATPPARQI